MFSIPFHKCVHFQIQTSHCNYTNYSDRIPELKSTRVYKDRSAVAAVSYRRAALPSFGTVLVSVRLLQMFARHVLHSVTTLVMLTKDKLKFFVEVF